MGKLKQLTPRSRKQRESTKPPELSSEEMEEVPDTLKCPCKKRLCSRRLGYLYVNNTVGPIQGIPPTQKSLLLALIPGPSQLYHFNTTSCTLNASSYKLVLQSHDPTLRALVLFEG